MVSHRSCGKDSPLVLAWLFFDEFIVSQAKERMLFMRVTSKSARLLLPFLPFLILGTLGFDRRTAKTPGVTDTEIKLGATSPLTGPLAFYSEIPTSAKAYFQKVNDEGGVHGRKITYLVEDDMYAAPKTIEGTRKLVERDGVFALFNSLGNVHLAVIPYVKEKNIPDFFVSDGSKGHSGANVFLGLASWADDARSLARHIAENYSGKTVGFLGQNDTFGKEGIEAAKEILKGKVKFGPEETYEAGAPAVDSQVVNLMNAKVDVVLAMTVPTITAGAAKLAAQKGWKPKWYVSAINCAPVTIALGGAATEGMVAGMYFRFPDDSDPSVREHEKLLAKYAPTLKPSVLTIYGQGVAETMVEVLRRAGKNITRESAVKAAESLKDWKCSLCLFPSTLSEKEHNPYTKLGLMEVKGGKWVSLDKTAVTGVRN